MVAILLIAAWLRIQNLVDYYEASDEIWSVWHVQGSFDQMMTRVAYDWPPLFSMLSWGWMQLVGQTLEAHRYLMVLLSMLGAVSLYRAALLLYRRIQSGPLNPDRVQVAALVTCGVFISMGYVIFASVEVRAYALLLTLGPLSLWQTLRWLNRPTSLARTVVLAVFMAALFATSFTAPIFIGYLTVLVLLLQPRALLRWILAVGSLTAVFSVPVLQRFLTSASTRLNVMFVPLDPFLEQMYRVFLDFVGNPWYVILLLTAVLLFLLYVHHLRYRWQMLVLFAAFIAFPVVIYFVLERREFLHVRYLWPLTVGLALLIGAAALVVPRVLRIGLVAAVFVMFWIPGQVNYRRGAAESTPARMILSWLADHIRPGDVIIQDPLSVPASSRAWRMSLDYFIPQYFPEGYLPYVDEPGDHARIWYLRTQGWENDTDLEARIAQGRQPSIFVGPWSYHLQLFEGPPQWEGVSFGDLVGFHGYEIETNPGAFGEADTIAVKLWWSAIALLAQDYSISLALTTESGEIVTQVDGSAHAPTTPNSMTQWQPGETYEDYRSLTVPDTLEAGHYALVVRVYDWRTGERLIPAQTGKFESFRGDALLLRWIEIIAW
jgi:hypothetical protein